MVICPDCGKEVPKAKFCKNCGAYISNIEETTMIEDNYVEIPAENQSEEVIEVNPTPVIPQSGNQVKFCYNCGFKLDNDFNFCPNCGQDLSGQVAVSKNKSVASKDKSVLLAIILSVLLPGLGQIYLGLDRKGCLFLIAYVISAILILLIIGFVLMAILWIWALVDTIMSANALNRGEEVKDKLL